MKTDDLLNGSFIEQNQKHTSIVVFVCTCNTLSSNYLKDLTVEFTY